MNPRLTFASAVVAAALSVAVVPVNGQDRGASGQQRGRERATQRSQAARPAAARPSESRQAQAPRALARGSESRQVAAPQSTARGNEGRQYSAPPAAARATGSRQTLAPQVAPRVTEGRPGVGAQAVPRGAARSQGANPAPTARGSESRQAAAPQLTARGNGVRLYSAPQAPARSAAGPQPTAPQVAPRSSDGRDYVGARAVPRGDAGVPSQPRAASQPYDGYGSPGYRSDDRRDYARPAGGYNSYYPRQYVRPYHFEPYRPFRFSRPYYAFRPHLDIGFGLWLGVSVPYPWAYFGAYRPRVYGYYPDGYYSAWQTVQYYGGVSFDIQPSDADLYVDGEYVGMVGTFSPYGEPLTLLPGLHQIAIVRDGFRTLEFEVRIEPGQVIPLRGVMELGF